MRSREAFVMGKGKQEKKKKKQKVLQTSRGESSLKRNHSPQIQRNLTRS